MDVIINTHVLIWYIEGSEKLSQNARDIIEISADKVYLNIVSLWEIAIKVNINKLKLSYEFSDLPKLLSQLNIQIIDIIFTDLEAYTKLPLHHRDPFDRLIIAQAQNRSLAIISKDENFKKYSVQVLWD